MRNSAVSESHEWQVMVSTAVEKSLKRLPSWEQERIRRRVDALQAGPRTGKPLAGRSEWCLRVGARRLLFRVDDAAQTLVVVALGSRGDIYKKP